MEEKESIENQEDKIEKPEIINEKPPKSLFIFIIILLLIIIGITITLVILSI